MIRPNPLDGRLAETFSKYVRAVDGVERQRLGAQLDVLAAQVLTHQPKERSDVSASNEDPGEAACHP